MDERTQLTHYGLAQTSEGYFYLHQGRNATNFVGLSKPSPFEVTNRSACPHLINAASPVPDRVHWSFFIKHIHDPLVKAMLPIPKDSNGDIYYLNDSKGELTPMLVALSRLSSPIYPAVFSASQYSKKQIIEFLNVSNIGTIVITGLESEHSVIMHELAAEAIFAKRQLLLVGEAHIVLHNKRIKRIETGLWDVDEIKFASLPLESIGAHVLRRFARGDQIDADIAERVRK